MGAIGYSMQRRRPKRRWVVLALLALFCGAGLFFTFVRPLTSMMRADAQSLVMLSRVYKNAQGETLPYRLLVPPAVIPGKRYPLVLSLHGGGCEGTDNEKQLFSVVPIFTTVYARQNFPCYVLAPQCPVNTAWVDERATTRDGYRFLNAPSDPLRLALEITASLPEEYPIDRGRVYVIGYSRGATGGCDSLIRAPDLFAAGTLICGRGVPSKASVIADIPVWIAHGAHDPVISRECSRALVRSLRRAGGAPRYIEYAKGDHEVGWNALQEPGLLPWLFAQHR